MIVFFFLLFHHSSSLTFQWNLAFFRIFKHTNCWMYKKKHQARKQPVYFCQNLEYLFCPCPPCICFFSSHHILQIITCWFCLSKSHRHKFYLKVLDILRSTLFANFPAPQTPTATSTEMKHWPRVNMKIFQWVKRCPRSSTSEILPEKTITLLLISLKRGLVGQLWWRVRPMDLGVIEQI